jgi:hypothetical protein
MKDKSFKLAEKEILDLIESINVIAKYFVDKEMPDQAHHAISLCREIRFYILEDKKS